MVNLSDGLAYQPIFTVSEKVYCSRSFFDLKSIEFIFNTLLGSARIDG